MRHRNHHQAPPVPRPVPMLGQGPSREQQAQMAIRQMIGDLSMSIYRELAVTHIATLDVHHDLDRKALMGIAKQATAAAEAYFEGLGIISRT